MVTPSNPCEEFEIATLQRVRGALDAASIAGLETHLRSCSGCRHFADSADVTEAALRGRVREAANRRDWDRVRAGFRARLRTNRNKMLWELASFVPMVAIGLWVFEPTTGIVFALLVLAIPAFVYWRLIIPKGRRARQAESIDTEMLNYYRKDLDDEIRGLRGGRLLIIAFGALFAWTLLFMTVRVVEALLRGQGFPNVESDVATFVTFALIGGVMWLRSRSVLPRLVRERAELGE